MTLQHESPVWDGQESKASNANTSKWAGTFSLLRAWPIRTQLLVSIAVVCMLAAGIAGVLAVYRANDRARVEVQATLEIAERLISETVRGLPSDAEPEIAVRYVSQQLRYFRHVETSFVNTSGHKAVILSPPMLGIEDSVERAPQWFEQLVLSEPEQRRVPVNVSGRQIGAFVVTGKPADEIAEVWSDLSEVSLVAGIVVALMFAMLYWVLGRILKPIETLSAGLKELEAGHYGARVSKPGVLELEPIANSFNALAGALDGAMAENRDLLRHLISVQEDERRQIATELHDEAGPCLFGITANAGSLFTLINGLEDSMREKGTERLEAILASADRLKTLNRSRLKTLRPIAIGRVSLEELLTDLLAEFQKRHPEVNFFLAIEPIAPSYGEAIDLTIYRCLQQGLTNALQHGGARNIDAQLLLRDREDEAGQDLVLTMTDDGTGIPARTPVGFGLSAMRERVIAVEGTCTVTRAEPQGTTVTITIPVPKTGLPTTRNVLTSESHA